MTTIAADASLYPPRRSAYVVAAMLFAAIAFSYLDNQVLTLFIDPIRHDLDISDTEVSALYGFAPMLLFALLGVPVGRLVDKIERRYILATGIALWSLMAAMCGFAWNFWSFFAARVGVGIGAVCLSPLAFSLLADCFEPRLRTRAINVNVLGVYAGMGLSLIIGGLLLSTLAQSAPLPIIGGLAYWRQVFILTSLPGFGMATIALTMPEPVRQDVANHLLEKHPGDVKLVAYIRANAGTMAAVFLAESLIAFTATGLFAWSPSYFIRNYGLGAATIGRVLGILLMTCGTIGAVSGSILSDSWVAKGIPAAKFKVAAIGIACAVPGIAALPFVSSPFAAFACMGASLVFLPLSSVANMAMVQDIFPNRLRGQGSSVILLLQSLFGVGGGPVAVGLISDGFSRHSNRLAFAVSFAALPPIVIYVVVYLVGRRSYERTAMRLR